MFQIKVAEKIKIHILCSATFSENCAVYEMVSKYIVEPERPQMAVQQRVPCWISKATCTQAHAHDRVPTLTHACTYPHRNMESLLLFHGNNGFVNTPQCYVTCALPFLFSVFQDSILHPTRTVHILLLDPLHYTQYIKCLQNS
jgi:hypothetical protein